MKRFLALALLALPSLLWAETYRQTVSATATSSTTVLRRPTDVLSVCNLGANEAYVRVFTELDTTGAATTSNVLIPAGSATAPYCVVFQKGETTPAYIAAVSAVCDTGETATLHLIGG